MVRERDQSASTKLSPPVFSSREQTAVTNVERCLQKIEQHETQLNAFVEVYAENAKFHAKNLSITDISAKPLAGITLAIKDLFDYSGRPTRAGSLATPDTPATTSAYSVQQMENAGAIIIGKTQTVEFAFGGWGTNQVMGAPWNPWDLLVHRVPGGSSSGSAVAVASGMAMAALGTDTGGSVRTPASYCGLVGTKTSSGLVSRSGVFPLCPTHDTVGTLTKTVRDAASILQVISGSDPDDPISTKAPRIDFLSGIDDGVDGCQIGVLEEHELEAASNDVRRVYEKAVRVLEGAGAEISPHTLPRSLMSYLDDSGCLMASESYMSLGNLVDREDSPVDPVIRERVLAGRKISDEEYSKMLVLRNQAQEHFLNGLGNFRALIMPTCPNTAIPVEDVDETVIVTPFGRFVNYLDLAAISVPIGLASDGLPVGLQVVVRKFDDALAFRIAQAIESAIGTFSPEGA